MKLTRAKHKENIENNKKHLNGLKGRNAAAKWREYATQCMVEILRSIKANLEFFQKIILKK